MLILSFYHHYFHQKNSQFLEIYKFLNLKKKPKKIVCLGGITFNNIKRTTLLNVDAIAAISLFKIKIQIFAIIMDVEFIKKSSKNSKFFCCR